jgi:3-oxoacyl-[acyl-carrier protein] reductase
MDLGLHDSVVLVTGSSGGIGMSIAHAFAAEGASVVLNGRDEAKLQQAVDRIQCKHGVKNGSVVGVKADVCNLPDAENLVASCVRSFGRIDILVNNVGGRVGRPFLAETTDEHWVKSLDINLVQITRLTRLAIPHMRAGGSAITNIASVSGVTPECGRNGQYGAAKAALIYLSRRWALELCAQKIRVNAISPGSIYAEGTGWERYRLRNPEGFAEYVRSAFPMGRLGSPEEVADAVVFVSAPRTQWINGQHIIVDGLQRPLDTVERRVP